MSYDIDLTCACCGSTLRKPYDPDVVYVDGQCSLNVTWNYSGIFYRVLDQERGFRVLYGKTGEATIPLLEAAIAQLADDATDNGYDATEGNAKRALKKLLEMARMHPQGVWQGD